MLFAGLDTFFTVLTTTGLCSAAILITGLALNLKPQPFTWCRLFAEVILIAFIAVCAMSWLQTRQNLKIFMNPLPVPNEVHVQHGRSILFSSYVHFTGPPVVIEAIIQSKELEAVPDGCQRDAMREVTWSSRDQRFGGVGGNQPPCPTHGFFTGTIKAMLFKVGPKDGG